MMTTSRRAAILTGAAALLPSTGFSADAAVPRIAMAGLAHGHARGHFNRNLRRTDIQLVGVAEENTQLRHSYFESFKLDPALGFDSLETMLDRVKPDGVLAFTSTFDHLRVVQACAKHRVPVMMEKPLAVSTQHAREMQQLANAAGIPLLVNYETTWYSSNRAAHDLATAGKLGDIYKFVFHDGHNGPREIGVPDEFFSWLTDPAKNGAGALFDFGCYGANLMTWFMGNQRPIAVSAFTQRIKPAIYPKVDDDATIIVQYPKTQGIIQASWNWPFSRKDMEVYGRSGYAITVREEGLRLRLPGKDEETLKSSPIPQPENDSLTLFSSVIRSKSTNTTGLSSLANNMIVTEILDAARRSAETGRTIRLGTA